MIDKQLLIDTLNTRANTYGDARRDAYLDLRDEIQAGEYDAPITDEGNSTTVRTGPDAEALRERLLVLTEGNISAATNLERFVIGGR